MDTEKENSQTETPSSSVDAENHSPHDKQEPEQCVEHTKKPPPVGVEADYEAKPDEDDDGRRTSDDHQETTSGGGDHGEEIEAGGDGEEQATTKNNEDGEEKEEEKEEEDEKEASPQPDLLPDLSKVSEEVDQYISDINNNRLLGSKGGGDDESPKSCRDDDDIHESPKSRLGDDDVHEPPISCPDDDDVHESCPDDDDVVHEPPKSCPDDDDDVHEPPKSCPDGDDDDVHESPKPCPDGDNVHDDDVVPICVEQFVFLLVDKLEGYSSGETAVKWSQLEEEDAATLLEAVNRICRLYTSLSQFSSHKKYAKSISRIGGVLHRAMCFLEEEFRSYLDDYKFPDPAELNKQQQQQQPADPEAAGGNEEEEETQPQAAAENSAEQADSGGDNNNNNNKQQQEEPQAPEEEPTDFPGYPEETVSNLNRLAKAMTFGGYQTECWQVYFVSRRNALEKSLRKLGYEGHSIDDAQKLSWEIMERAISTWITTFKHCATVLFSCERKLTDAVFNDLSISSETIFTDLSGGLVIHFLIFPEAVAMTKRSAEKLFKFLDLFETMRDHLPTMYINFPPQYVNELKAEAALTKGRLGEAMVGIFLELENSILSDSGKTPVPGGAVHPLTRYTMNYLKLAADYKETLEQVFREHLHIERADSATGSDFDYNSQPVQSYKPPTAPKQSPFEIQIKKVMDLLDVNLESKSKIYKDLSLCSIFMMNNGRYILQKVRGCPPISKLMGDHWVRRQSQELRQYHKTYQRETWGRLLQCLSIEGLLNSHGKVNKPVLKERFKNFNFMFDEIYRTQSTWIISDEQLQSELRVSISNMVVPAYRSFLARYSQIFTPGRQTEKYIKYQGEDIETYIDELFDGNAK